MNILLVTAMDLNAPEPWYMIRVLAEFGHLHVIAALPEDNTAAQSAFTLEEPTLTDMRVRYPDASFYHAHGASAIDCVRAALTTPDWLPQIDLVLLGAERGACFGLSAWLSEQTQAALLAYELGVPALSFYQVLGTPQHWEGVGYAAERLVRTLRDLPQLPHMALHVNVPNFRPNECEGFAIVKAGNTLAAAGKLNRRSTTWTIEPIAPQIADPPCGTDQWAIGQGLIAVTPLWGWNPGDQGAQLEHMAALSSAVARLGSSRAYRAAIDQLLNHAVSYDYHFKGAVISAAPGFCVAHRAASFASDVDPQIEQPILEYAAGRVLDVGCGPGRISIYLMTQRQNHVTAAVGIDSSPASLADFERRWAQEVTAPCQTYCLDVRSTELATLGTFDTVLLFGDTLGIGGNPNGVARLLEQLRSLVPRQGKLLVSGRDLLHSKSRDEQLLNEENVRQGFPAGERLLRMTFERHDTGWFQCYYASLDEIKSLGYAAGWRLLTEHTQWRDEQYGAILEAI